MPDAGTVELAPNQQQRLSDETQNNNGNDTSPPSIGEGAQEKFIPITVLLMMVANMMGVLVCGWVVLVFVQGGMVVSLETKDCVFVTLLFFLVFFHCWRQYCPEAYRSLAEATQSLSADYLSVPNNIQQLALPISYISRLFYCSKFVSTMTSVVLSVMRLASQDFGKKEVENKESRDFALKFFYGLTLAQALVLLFAEALSFPIRWNSVGLADGLGDDLEVGLRTTGNSVGLADGPGDGPEDGLITRGNSVGLAEGPGDGLEVQLMTEENSVRLADGPGDGPEDGLITRGNSVGLADGPGDELEDGPVNQGIKCNGVAQMMALPANLSNDFNSEGPADSRSNLRQRRRQKVVIKLSMENKLKRKKAPTALAGLDGIISAAIDSKEDKIVVMGNGIDVTTGENKKEEKTEDKGAEVM